MFSLNDSINSRHSGKLECTHQAKAFRVKNGLGVGPRHHRRSRHALRHIQQQLYDPCVTSELSTVTWIAKTLLLHEHSSLGKNLYLQRSTEFIGQQGKFPVLFLAG